jgi:peptidoglycan/LPS O-acetylase OafA/YrhL
MAGVVGLCVATRAGELSNTLTEPLVATATGGLLIALAGDGAKRLRTVLSGRALASIGSFSYSIYLLHAPVLQLVWQYVMRPLGLPLHDGYALAVLLAVGIPASLGVGWAFYLAIEQSCQPRTRPHPKLTPNSEAITL